MTDEQLYLTGDFLALVDRHAGKMREMLDRRYPTADADQAIQWAFDDLRERGPDEAYLRQYNLRPWLFSRAAKAAVEMIGVLQSSCLLVC